MKRSLFVRVRVKRQSQLSCSCIASACLVRLFCGYIFIHIVGAHSLDVVDDNNADKMSGTHAHLC